MPDTPGVWREIFVYRVWKVVHVYRIEEVGSRFYRVLEYTSDARYCYREMQPPTGAREYPWPEWERHGAGHPYAGPSPAPSCVITRDASMEANLSLGMGAAEPTPASEAPAQRKSDPATRPAFRGFGLFR
jgi:hypothetical protein